MKRAKLTAAGFLNAKLGPEIERRRLAGRKRRGLVLVDESAHNRFRANLPPHVKSEPTETAAQSLWRLTTEDVRGFATTYFATFAAVLVFIM